MAPVVGLPHGTAPHIGMTGADVWRVLRANLWLILLTLFASLIIGYVVNRVLEKYSPRYTATGYVKIQAPTSWNFQTRTEEALSNFAGLTVEQRTQAMLIKNDSLFTKVLQSPSSKIRSTGWFQKFVSPQTRPDGTVRSSLDVAAAKKSLNESFVAATVDGSDLDSISMTCANGSDARDIVEAIVNYHLDVQDQLITQRELDKQNLLGQAQEMQKAHIKDLSEKLHTFAGQLNIEGNGKSDKLSARDAELSRLADQRFALQTEQLANGTYLTGLMDQVNRGEEPPFIESKVLEDSYVKTYQEQKDFFEARLKTTPQTGSENISRKNDQTQFDYYAGKLEDAKEAARNRIRTEAVTEAQSKQATLTQNLEAINKRIDAAHEELGSLNTAMGDYQMISDELIRGREELRQTTEQLDALSAIIQQTAHGVMWAPSGEPIVPETPSFPKLYVTMGVTTMLGLAAAIGIAFLRELTDTSVRSPRDITRVGNLTLLGMVPHEDDDPQSQGVPLPMVIFQAPNSIMAEGFRQVRTRLQHAASLDTTRTILITSPSPGDGKSVVAANLAAGLALNGRAILLVDANFRRPMLDKYFSVDNSVGLSDVLGGIDRFESAVHRTRRAKSRHHAKRPATGECDGIARRANAAGFDRSRLGRLRPYPVRLRPTARGQRNRRPRAARRRRGNGRPSPHQQSRPASAPPR